MALRASPRHVFHNDPLAPSSCCALPHWRQLTSTTFSEYLLYGIYNHKKNPHNQLFVWDTGDTCRMTDMRLRITVWIACTALPVMVLRMLSDGGAQDGESTGVKRTVETLSPTHGNRRWRRYGEQSRQGDGDRLGRGVRLGQCRKESFLRGAKRARRRVLDDNELVRFGNEGCCSGPSADTFSLRVRD